MSLVSQWQEQWQQVLPKDTSGRERKSKYACPYHFAHWHSSRGNWGNKPAEVNMAAIWQSFCLIPRRFNQTFVFVTRFILRNNCLKKPSYFSAVSQFAAPVVNIHLHPVPMFSASGNSHQIISISLLLGSCTICVQMFLLLTWKSGCVVPETFINLGFSSWVCCWNLIIWL